MGFDMTTVKCIPGFIWALPMSLLTWIFFCIPHLCRETFCSVWIDEHLCITWEIDKRSEFYEEAMEGWFGFVLGCNRIVVDIDFPTKEVSGVNIGSLYRDHPHYMKMQHELRHVLQNYMWGFLFYPAYILDSFYLWLFKRNKHAYLDNYFERDARKFAGQKVDIPREEWPEGPYDRWPWWN